MKYYKFQKSPTHFCFTTSKECSGQISQKSVEFWYPINSFVCRNDAWSFSRSFLQFSFVELKKLVIHIFFRNLHLLSFPTIYSLPCFSLKWCACEFFPGGRGKTPAKVRSKLNWLCVTGFPSKLTCLVSRFTFIQCDVTLNWLCVTAFPS